MSRVRKAFLDRSSVALFASSLKHPTVRGRKARKKLQVLFLCFINQFVIFEVDNWGSWMQLQLASPGCYGPSWSYEARLWNHADSAAGEALWAQMLEGAPRVPLPLQFGPQKQWIPWIGNDSK